MWQMIRNITIIAIKAKFIKISTDIKGKRRKFPVSGSQKVGSKSSFEAIDSFLKDIGEDM